MPRTTLEERVAELEKQVSGLLAERAGAQAAKDWRRTRGAFTGDEVMREVFAEGQKIREAERKRARSPRRKKSKAAPCR
jgi:hypothetical protein